jgi:hypothetical protein
MMVGFLAIERWRERDAPRKVDERGNGGRRDIKARITTPAIMRLSLTERNGAACEYQFTS